MLPNFKILAFFWREFCQEKKKRMGRSKQFKDDCAFEEFKLKKFKSIRKVTTIASKSSKTKKIQVDPGSPDLALKSSKSKTSSKKLRVNVFKHTT